MRFKSLVTAVFALSLSCPLFAMDYDQGFNDLDEQAVRAYQMECTGCHGSNAAGRNGMAPNFTQEWFRLTKADNELVRNLHAGFKTPGKFYSGGACPSSSLTDDELVDILAVMRQLAGQ
jgi:mono/diheme cytochrome c family protein